MTHLTYTDVDPHVSPCQNSGTACETRGVQAYLGVGVVHISHSWGLEKRRFSEQVECHSILPQTHASMSQN